MSLAARSAVRAWRLDAPLALALALGAVLVALTFVGYDGADDRSYALGAEAWLRHFPAVAADHWAIRHTVVLPVALSLAVFGRHEFALAVPSLLYFFGFIAVNYFFARRFLGGRLAALLALLLAATPEFVVQASYINIDIAEVFFASLAFWLFIAGGAEPRRPGWLIGAGAAAGLAFLTRETSCVLPVFFAVCFLFDEKPARRQYLWLALGFVAVVGLETAYFAAMTGDFLYRYRMDAHHDTVNRARELHRMTASGGALDREGNLSVSLWADPFLMLFASQKYGLLFYLAIPAAVWVWLARDLKPLEGAVLRRAARLALLWILFVSGAFMILYLVPRYYIVAAWAAVLLVAYAFHRFSRSTKRRWAVAAVAALLAVNALSLYVENTNPRFAEHALVTWLKDHPGVTVHADPDMVRRSGLLLEFAGLEGRLSGDPARPGDVAVFSPRNLELCRQMGTCKARLYRPQPGWRELGRAAGKPRALGGLLRALFLNRLIPRQIMQKIESPEPGIVIYRAG